MIQWYDFTVTLAQDVIISVESDGSGLDVVASAASQSDFLRLLQVQSIISAK